MKKFNHQINVRLTDEEIKAMDALNQSIFKGEANYAMLCRFLIKEGIKNVSSKK
jgi:hypothetical protein